MRTAASQTATFASLEADAGRMTASLEKGSICFFWC